MLSTRVGKTFVILALALYLKHLYAVVIALLTLVCNTILAKARSIGICVIRLNSLKGSNAASLD